jgi:hypothetical protein
MTDHTEADNHPHTAGQVNAKRYSPDREPLAILAQLALFSEHNQAMHHAVEALGRAVGCLLLHHPQASELGARLQDRLAEWRSVHARLRPFTPGATRTSSPGGRRLGSS